MEIFETQKLVNVKGVAPYSLSLQCVFFSYLWRLFIFYINS